MATKMSDSELPLRVIEGVQQHDHLEQIVPNYGFVGSSQAEAARSHRLLHHQNDNHNNDGDGPAISRADVVFGIFYVVLLLLIYMAALLLRHYRVYWHYGGRNRLNESPLPLGREEMERRRREADEEQGADSQEPHRTLTRLSIQDQASFLRQLLPAKTMAAKEDLVSLASSAPIAPGRKDGATPDKATEDATGPMEATWKDEDDTEDVDCPHQEATSSHNNPMCAICLNDFEVGDEIVMEPQCYHPFHAECIHAWMKKSCVCPTCRTSLYAQQDVYDYCRGKDTSRGRKDSSNNNKT